MFDAEDQDENEKIEYEEAPDEAAEEALLEAARDALLEAANEDAGKSAYAKEKGGQLSKD
jgi:hypothetical protein